LENYQAFRKKVKDIVNNSNYGAKTKAFPPVKYSENRFVMVKGDASPFNGNIAYWSNRQSKLYDGATTKALVKQNHACGHCGLKFVDDERIHLHHIDGNHDNWKANNLMAIHESCHDYVHNSKQS
jgi:5-methylcytosine-specific restriction endonuclease McrA